MFIFCYISGCKVWRRKARKLAKKGSSVITTGRVKDGVPVRGRPLGVHSGTRGRPPLHGPKHHTSSLDDAGSLHYKVCSLVLVVLLNIMIYPVNMLCL